MEKIAIIDENDNIICKNTISYVKENNFLHRAVFVLVKNSLGEVFVHERAKQHKMFPLYWDFFVGGFVPYEENYKEASIRELKEEIGVDVESITYVGKIHYSRKNDRFIGEIYSVTIDDELTFQEDEISDGQFLAIEQFSEFFKDKKIKPTAIAIWNLFWKEFGVKSLDFLVDECDVRKIA